jgi:hypothetical protein
MIHIVKPAAPAVLLAKGTIATQEMCEAFESAPDDYLSGVKLLSKFKRSICAAKTVQNALRDAQHKKCAFCESFILHISYANIEHRMDQPLLVVPALQPTIQEEPLSAQK